MKKAEIFFASDENYAPHLCSAMVSILENTKGEINFHIIDCKISPQSKEKLTSLRGCNIQFYPCDNLLLERFPDIRHYSVNCYARYYIPKLRPDLKKVLYLDCDIIVKCDIFELYDIDLNGFSLGAVEEDFYKENRENLRSFCPDFKSGRYFNSGVLLMDIEKLQGCEKRLEELTLKYKDVLSCPDQDVYNILFEDNFYPLPQKYNYMPYFKNAKTVSIIHYTATKPWRDIFCKMGFEYRKYFKKTPFYTGLFSSFR